jgi:hypothetical protein
MTIYILLGKLQRTAFEKFDSIEDRDQKAKQIIESLGGKMISLYSNCEVELIDISSNKIFLWLWSSVRDLISWENLVRDLSF